MNTHLLVGTKKGLFIFQSADREYWKMCGPFLHGKEITHATHDPRSNRVFVAANDPWFGSEILYSDDLGQSSWTTAKRNAAFSTDSGQKIERIWHIEPAGEPHTLWAGVAPAALFRTEDNGESWDEIPSLSAHPTRPQWGPGGGGLCLHSIVQDPVNPRRAFTGISAAGVFRTLDGGATWETANRGTRAEFLPDKRPEFGQCVHKLLAAPSNPNLLYQQNHCGVYKSSDDGRSWTEITAGLPSDFGFPLAIHPRDENTVYVIPLVGGEFRCPHNGRFTIYRTRDGGTTWKPLNQGLPTEGAYFGVLRECLTTDRHNSVGIYTGTNTGKIFATRDEGDNWYELADNLPPIFSMHAF